MRESGNGRPRRESGDRPRRDSDGRADTWITFVPCVVLVLVSVALAGGPGNLAEIIENGLWEIGSTAWAWIARVL